MLGAVRSLSDISSPQTWQQGRRIPRSWRIGGYLRNRTCRKEICMCIYIYTHRLSPILVGSINVHLCDIATPILLNWAPKFGSSHFRGWNISNITGPKGGIHTVKEPWKMETSSNKTEPCWNNLKASIVLDIPLPSRRSNNLKAPSSLTGKTCAS